MIFSTSVMIVLTLTGSFLKSGLRPNSRSRLMIS